MRGAVAGVLIGAVVVGSILGFGVGRWARGSNPSSGSSDAAKPSSGRIGSSKSADDFESGGIAGAVLPAVDFRDAAGFEDYVRGLVALGVDENLAKWLALASLAEADFQAAAELAQSEDLIGWWASGAALVDLDATVDVIDSLPEKLAIRAIYAASGTVGRRQPERGFELLKKLPPSDATEAAFPFFEEWASASLPAARRAAMALDPGRFRERALAGVFHAWNEGDREEMLEWAVGQGPEIGRKAFWSVYEMAGIRDAAAILELAQKFPAAVDTMLIAQFADALTELGSPGWEAVMALPPGQMRNQLLLRYGENLGRTDAARLWELAQSLPSGERTYLLRLGTRNVAKAAPREMAELAVRGELGASYGVDSVMESWAADDPLAAYAWGLARWNQRQGSSALGSVLSTWSQTDPNAATRALVKLPDGLRAKFLPDVVEAWATNEPEEAFRWASGRPPLEQTSAVAAALEGWASEDPAAAATAARGVLPDGLNDALKKVAWEYGQVSPDDAMSWAHGLQGVDAQRVTVAEVANSWGRRDASAASDYLASLPEGELRDQAVGGFVSAITNLDPPTAAQWALSIGDDSLQGQRMQSALRSWKEKDPAEARAFVEALPDAALREKMMGVVK